MWKHGFRAGRRATRLRVRVGRSTSEPGSALGGAIHPERSVEIRRGRRGLAFPEEAAALFDQLVAGAKQELGVVPDWRAVLELKRGASGEGGDGPVQRVVISECPTCGEASVESREGPVRVSPATLELARRDGEVHDLSRSAADATCLGRRANW